MTTEEIEAFVAICEAKSISKAAEKLFISQPSLSTKLKTLEQETSCTLLARGKGQRELSLTEAGRRFYDLALQYRSIIRQMREVGTQAVPEKLRVSSLNSVGTYLMTPVYERFMQQNRETVLEVQDLPTLPVCASLERRETDLAFTGTAPGRIEQPCVFGAHGVGVHWGRVRVPLYVLTGAGPPA